IWRIFSARYFLSDLKKRTCTFVRPSKWDDPYENFLEQCRFTYNGESIDARPVFRRFFGQCWTDQTEETDATWRIYAPEKDGIRVKSSIGGLAAALNDPN